MTIFSGNRCFLGKTWCLWCTVLQCWPPVFYRKIKATGVLVLVLCMASVSVQAGIGMGNPFSFQVDGLDFRQNTTPNEKAAWAALVDQGIDKIQAARYIFKERVKTKP